MRDHQGRVGSAAQRASREWRERLRSSGQMRGPGLILVWVLVAILMLLGFILGLFFLILGWILLPFLRYGAKRRARARARSGSAYGQTAGSAEYRAHRDEKGAHLIEGDYEIKKDPARNKS